MATEERTRLLVATGAAAADLDALPPLVRFLIDSAFEILVVTPVLPTGLQWLVSDTDRARHEADERLQKVMGQLGGSGATGRIGDESPLTAIADAVRDFRPTHILVALRAADHAAWQEEQLTDLIRRRFHIPMTVFELDRGGHVAATSHA